MAPVACLLMDHPSFSCIVIYRILCPGLPTSSGQGELSIWLPSRCSSLLQPGNPDGSVAILCWWCHGLLSGWC